MGSDHNSPLSRDQAAVRIEKTAQDGFGVGGVQVFCWLVEQHDARR